MEMLSPLEILLKLQIAAANTFQVIQQGRTNRASSSHGVESFGRSILLNNMKNRYSMSIVHENMEDKT